MYQKKNTWKLTVKPKLHFQRFEFKYYLPFELINPIKEKLLKYMHWDPFVADKEKKFYEVISLYYDSPEHEYYWEKIDGMVDRRKIRCRTYGGSKKFFYEIKRKYDMIVNKDRFESIGNQVNLEKALNSNIIQKDLAAELTYEFMSKKLAPQLLVSYERQPLIGIYEDRLRVTIDGNIWAADRKEEKMESDNWEPVLTNGAILEIKYNNSLPYWLPLLIQRHDLSRISYSKYCKSLEKVRGINLG